MDFDIELSHEKTSSALARQPEFPQSRVSVRRALPQIPETSDLGFQS